MSLKSSSIQSDLKSFQLDEAVMNKPRVPLERHSAVKKQQFRTILQDKETCDTSK